MAIKRDAADKWFSECVRLQANNTCQHTFKTNVTLDCCHIIGRRNKAVRWSMDNAICMSRSSHRYFTENPLEFAMFCKELLGEGHLDLLREKSNQIYKTTKRIRQEIAKHYREQHRKLSDAILDNGDYTIVSWN